MNVTRQGVIARELTCETCLVASLSQVAVSSLSHQCSTPRRDVEMVT